MKISNAIMIISIVISSLFTGCSDENQNSIQNANISITSATSAELDKAYVPSLFYSNIFPVPNASIAMSTNNTFEKLKVQWLDYKSTIENTHNEHDFSGYFNDINHSIDTADRLLQTTIQSDTYPADISIAHEALESVRDNLGKMRKEIDSNYFMDYVTTAHHAMEPIAGAVTQFSQNSITIEQLCTKLESSLPLFTTSWQTLQSEYNANSISKLYNHSTPKNTHMSNNINAMSKTLTNLSTTLPTCDANVSIEAKKIKPIFVKIFLGFGDFITPFKDKMILMEKSLVAGLYCTNNPPDVMATCGDIENIKDLIDNFEQHAKAFQSQYPIIIGKLNLPEAIYWSNYFTTINTAIANAKSIADKASTAEELKPAHEAFESIRTTMHQLRSTYENFMFVMDYVTEYHNTMEPMAIAIKEIDNATQLTQSAIDTINSKLPIAQSTLVRLEASVKSMDVSAFKFDSTWHATQMSNITFQSQNLSNLKTAITENNTTDILKYTQLIKPKFVEFFKAFGAF